MVFLTRCSLKSEVSFKVKPLDTVYEDILLVWQTNVCSNVNMMHATSFLYSVHTFFELAVQTSDIILFFTRLCAVLNSLGFLFLLQM